MTNSILYSNFSFALPLTLLNGKVVEAGGIEPPSVSPLPRALHV